MCSLRNSLNNDYLLQQYIKSFVPCQVYYLETPHLKYRKYKYFLLVCLIPFRLFYINSEIHPFILNDEDLRDLQVFLHQNMNPFLKNNSYIDCVNFVAQFTENEILDQLREGRGKILGVINKEAQAEVVKAIEISKTLSKKDKKDVLKFLIG